MGISTSSSEITGSASPPRSRRPRLLFRLRNRSRLRRLPWLSRSSSPPAAALLVAALPRA